MFVPETCSVTELNVGFDQDKVLIKYSNNNMLKIIRGKHLNIQYRSFNLNTLLNSLLKQKRLLHSQS